MDIMVLSLAALAALAPSSPPSSTAGGFTANHARRSPGGAAASATITVRIISSSARISADQPPQPGMAPRPATIAAADGRQVAALIYDFE